MWPICSIWVPSTACIYAPNSRIWVEVGVQIKVNWGLRDWFEETIGPDWSFGSIFGAAHYSKLPSKVSWESGIRAKYAGSRESAWMSQCPVPGTDKQSWWFGWACVKICRLYPSVWIYSGIVQWNARHVCQPWEPMLQNLIKICCDLQYHVDVGRMSSCGNIFTCSRPDCSHAQQLLDLLNGIVLKEFPPQPKKLSSQNIAPIWVPWPE